MKNLVADVRAFHEMTDTPVLVIPTVPPDDRVTLRKSLIAEEVADELFPAMQEGDLVKIADALADSVCVLVGTALEYGIDLTRVWDEVHRSNMAKRDPITGKVARRADGKILKPAGWLPPYIYKALYPDG
jgi:predicted HAD superfamily Cof-like phosphohydrolase